jgi:hypothetical protein
VRLQKRNTIENNGVTSVDTTPEVVTRQLDALKYHLTGKIPAVTDLIKHGLGPTNREMHAMNGNGAANYLMSTDPQYLNEEGKLVVTDTDTKKLIETCQRQMCYSCICKISYLVVSTDISWDRAPKAARAALGRKLISETGKCTGWCDQDSICAMENLFKADPKRPDWLSSSARKFWGTLAKLAVELGRDKWNQQVKNYIEEHDTCCVFEYLGREPGQMK